MKRLRVVSAAVATVALSSSLFAQWPLYPYADAPRMPDGTLNLAAPAPRAVDGKPDLSGVWMARSTATAGGSMREAAPSPTRHGYPSASGA